MVIDPRRTATCDIADLFLPIRPGTDVLLFNGLLNYLRREDAVDWEFLEAHTEGFGAAMRAAKETAPSVPAVAAGCGVPEADVARFYHWFARTPRALTLFSQGVNQSSSGTDKVNAIINVHLATGRIGRAGAGPFSLTGQPNAMGGGRWARSPISSPRTWISRRSTSSAWAASGKPRPSRGGPA